jgi:lipopolysaccharide biosynthesis glycosyltransferase
MEFGFLTAKSYPWDRFLLVDNDIIFTFDISELFEISFDGNDLICARDRIGTKNPAVREWVKVNNLDEYLNSGIVVLNLRECIPFSKGSRN